MLINRQDSLHMYRLDFSKLLVISDRILNKNGKMGNMYNLILETTMHSVFPKHWDFNDSVPYLTVTRTEFSNYCILSNWNTKWANIPRFTLRQFHFLNVFSTDLDITFTAVHQVLSLCSLLWVPVPTIVHCNHRKSSRVLLSLKSLKNRAKHKLFLTLTLFMLLNDKALGMITHNNY